MGTNQVFIDFRWRPREDKEPEEEEQDPKKKVFMKENVLLLLVLCLRRQHQQLVYNQQRNVFAWRVAASQRGVEQQQPEEGE